MKKILQKGTVAFCIASLFLSGCGEDKTKNTQQNLSSEPSHKPSQEKVEPLQKESQEPVKALVVDGKTLFGKCVSCHGATGEKVALNVSKIIKDMSQEEIVAALQGYKEGTYGGKMKGLMQSQVQNLSTEEIEAIAQFLKK